MTPRMSMIGASIRKLFAPIDKTVLAMHMDIPDPYWSSTVLAMHMDADPYWSSVVLAMHMDDTGLTDMKGHTVTLVGNAARSNAQSRFGGYSAFFDGSGDYLGLGTSEDFSFGTGDFTIECFAYIPSYPGGGVSNDMSVFSMQASSGGYFLYLDNANGALKWFDGANELSSPTAIPVGIWTHIAASRASGTLRLFVDGVLKATRSGYTYNIGASGVAANRLGGNWPGDGTRYMKGYLDDVRVTKGVGRYTDNFVPPTKAFIDNSWVDEKAHVITANGNAVLSNAQSKFGGYSAYFDGVLDYLSIPHATDLNLATGDFTIEAWVYVTNMSYTQCLVEKDQTYGSTFPSYAILIGSTGGFSLIVGTGAGATYNQSLNSIAGVIPLNTWTHIAAIRQGTNLQLFANGNSCGFGIQTGTPTDGGKPLIVGYFPAGGTVAVDNYFNGYIDDLRITKGVARYTSPFIPQNRPFQEPNNTPVFLDEKGKSILPFGSAAISATQSKFGGYSASFNGVTDYLSTPASADFGFANSDFTIEMWLYGGSLTGALIDTRQFASQFGYFAISNGKLGVWNGSILMEGNATISNSTWIHVAIVRFKNDLSVYVNGLLDSVTYMPVDFGIIRPCFIGATYAGANFLNGYIDDLRVTKGVARYSGNFTPPVKAFPNL